MFRTKQRNETQFREINATTVYISETRANRADSMSLLRRNGLEPLTYQEAIVRLDQSPELKEQLKGKWFYLDGKDSQLSGYYTFNQKGELTQGKGDVERTIYVWKGSQPFSIDVLKDNYSRNNGGRYLLLAYHSPSLIARVVVGVRPGHETATTKIETPDGSRVDSELVSEFKPVVVKMASATQAGVLTAKITEVVKKVLRVIE